MDNFCTGADYNTQRFSQNKGVMGFIKIIGTPFPLVDIDFFPNFWVEGITEVYFRVLLIL